jgi:phosphoribosylformylglycinamidine synthase subunit PurQ / glutaminase
MKSAVIVFPGSNCDRDAVDALAKSGSKVEKIWYQDNELPSNLDLIVIPGGFSYGDYLRSGAMAAISPAMQEVKKLAKKGVHILGICNGFQVLIECNLLDGALLRNENIKFTCKDVYLKTENKDSKFTSLYDNNKAIKIPVAHMDGNYFANPDLLKSIEDNNQIAFRYVDKENMLTAESNPNGSIKNIAGIFNKNKNILGMMPHPERAIDINTGSKDGLLMFKSLINSF